ncbi:MAG: hypothetical protein K1X65_19685 [Caldilineales bacterium]|nr:hypothetical protein [Caldilineales bacterium]MCW5859754.1 hypothetical protein [Caldilineales bacterium]
MSLADSAKSGLTAAGGLLDKLPVIGAYRAKEMRREADKRLRETVARRLESYRRKLTGMERDLVSAGRLRSLPDLERAVGRLQLLIDRIRTAAYGYAPFFDLNKVREPELERLIGFDQAIGEKVDEINTRIEALNAAMQTGEGHQKALDELMDALNALHADFDQRSQAMIGAAVSPAMPDPSLDALPSPDAGH